MRTSIQPHGSHFMQVRLSHPREFAPHSTPQTQNPTRFPGLFPARFCAPKVLEKRADKPFTRCLDRRGGVVISDPLGSTGGDPNTLAPNRLKARPTPLRTSR